MKIKITPEEARQITNARNLLKKHLGNARKSNKDLSAWVDLRQKLSGEIAKLQGLATLSDEDASKLGAKSLQLSQIEAKITAANTHDAGIALQEEQSAVLNLLRQFASLTHKVFNPHIKEYVAQISESIRPWCLDDKLATHLALQTAASCSLHAVCLRRWGSFGYNLNEIMHAIDMAEQLLDGELKWDFSSNLKK